VKLITDETNRCTLQLNITFKTTFPKIAHYIGNLMYISAYIKLVGIEDNPNNNKA